MTRLSVVEANTAEAEKMDPGTPKQGGDAGSSILHSEAPRIPGEPGVWIFVIGDMVIFAVLFAVFLYYRALDLETFQLGSASNSQVLGALNTFLLLTSSWFVAGAVKLSRGAPTPVVPRLLGGAILCGIAFGVVKVIEYTAKFGEGITVWTNDFFMFYFVLTAVHFLHVVIGIGFLGFLVFKTRSPVWGEHDLSTIEAGGVYWHMVDLLWIVLFVLLYLAV